MLFIGKLLGLCPPLKSPEYMHVESCFTKEELVAVKREFCLHVLSKYTQTVDDVHLVEWCGLSTCPQYLCESLCRVVRMQQQGDGDGITLEDIIMAKAKCEKMDTRSSEDFAFDVLAGPQCLPGARVLTRLQLEEGIAAVMGLALGASGDALEGLQASASAIVSGALKCSDTQDGLSRDSFYKWCRVVPAVTQVLVSLLSKIGCSVCHHSDQLEQDHHREQQQVQPSSSGRAPNPLSIRLPELGWGLCSPTDGLLNPAWMWLLSQGLPPDLRVEWRLLFNSDRHGMSFSTFMGRVGEACPTLLLIKDKEGYLFGGIAQAPWKKTGAFYGDHSDIIFSLLPQTVLYPASGINTNFQWCGQGFSQLPNGIGFGGQVGNYGVWLDASFDHGMSRPVATYASPSLSSAQTFQIDVVELWLLKPPEEEDYSAHSGSAKGSSSASMNKTGGSRSVLNQAKEDQKIMEWAGVAKGYSAGVRDEPLEE